MQNIDSELIFKGDYGTFKVCKVWIYKDRIVYKIPLSGEQSIQINQIASVELGSFLIHPGTVVIETTGGKKYNIIISPNDQKQFRDIIYQTQRRNTEKNVTSEDISKDKKKCPFCAEMIMAEAKKCRFCGEFLDKVGAEAKNTIGNNDHHQVADVPQTINEEKSKDENLIFETSYNDNETKVYKDKTTYKPPFMDEQPMPISRIASIELGKPSINEVTVKLTDRQKCRIMVKRQDQEKYRNAVYAQLAELKKEKIAHLATLKKEKTERQKINNKYIFLGLVITGIIFVSILFKEFIGSVFLWLFFAATICLLIGLIKPAIFSHFLKVSDRKKIVKIFSIAIIIFLLSYWLFRTNEIIFLILTWMGLFIISLSKPSFFSRLIKIDAQRGKLITTFSTCGIISLFVIVVWTTGQSSNTINEKATTINEQHNQTQAIQNNTSDKQQAQKQTEPIKKETQKGIGVSRSQIMDKLVNDYNFTFQKDKPINGEENYIGENKYGLGTVRLTGEATNLSEVAIISSLSTVYSGNMASLILINALANMVDGNSDKWVGDELIKIGDLKSFSDEKVFGRNVFKVNFTYSSDSIPPVISLRIIPVK